VLPQWARTSCCCRRPSWNSGAEPLAGVFTGAQFPGVDKLVAKLPKVGPLASKGAIPVLIAAVKMAESQLRHTNARARVITTT